MVGVESLVASRRASVCTYRRSRHYIWHRSRPVYGSTMGVRARHVSLSIFPASRLKPRRVRNPPIGDCEVVLPTVRDRLEFQPSRAIWYRNIYYINRPSSPFPTDAPSRRRRRCVRGVRIASRSRCDRSPPRDGRSPESVESGRGRRPAGSCCPLALFVHARGRSLEPPPPGWDATGGAPRSRSVNGRRRSRPVRRSRRSRPPLTSSDQKISTSDFSACEYSSYRYTKTRSLEVETIVGLAGL